MTPARISSPNRRSIQMRVMRKSALRKNRITSLLELFEDFVVHPRIVMVRTPQHHDADTTFALERIERLACRLRIPLAGMPTMPAPDPSAPPEAMNALAAARRRVADMEINSCALRNGRCGRVAFD
jgi:hypothetical protein